MPNLAKKRTGLLVIALMGAAGCADSAPVTGASSSPAFDGIGWAGATIGATPQGITPTTIGTVEGSGVGTAGSGN